MLAEMIEAGREEPYLAAVYRTVYVDGDGSIVVSDARSRATLDLAEMPADANVVVVGRIVDLILNNARDTQSVVVGGEVAVTVADGVLGTLVCGESVTGRGCTLFGSVRDLIVPRSSIVTVRDGHATTARVTNGELRCNPGAVTMIEISGAVMLPSSIAQLRVVSPDAQIIVRRSTTIGSIDAPDLKQPSLALTSPRGGATERNVLIECVAGTIAFELSGVGLAVASNVRPFQIQGHGAFIVPSGRQLKAVEVFSPIVCELGEESSIVDFAGVFIPRAARHASVAAIRGRSFEYGGVAKQPNQLGERSATSVLEQATLRGVWIPDTGNGRRFLSELQDVAVVEPSVDPLALRRWRLRIPFAQSGSRGSQLLDVSDAALFAQELAALTDKKCGSGSIRTKTAWAAYRGRQLLSTSRWERFALGVFRCVGYGQAIGPPAIAWLLVSIMSAALVLWVDSGRAVCVCWPRVPPIEFLTAVGDFLLSPVTLVRLAPDAASSVSTLAGQGLVLLRIMAAVPFAFLSIAVARFLRADWPTA